MDDHKDTFTRVERHLYKLQHLTKTEEWSTRYYAVFNDHTGKPRRIPLGDNLDRARNKLGELRRKNDAEYDFDLPKRQREEEAKAKEEAERRGITLREWKEKYSKEISPQLGKKSGGLEREERCWKKLEPFFGDMPLCEIKRKHFRAYKKQRSEDTVMRDGKKVKVLVAADKELGFLRYLINLAAGEEDDDGNPILESVPLLQSKVERKRERDAAQARVRTRTAEPWEYEALLANMGREQQRYVICLREASMRLNEPRALTWDKIDLRKGLIRLAAEDVKENWPRRTPITWELRQVLEELREEQKKIPNLGGAVFTRKNGQPIKTIRTAWELALERGKITNLVPHDLRRTGITAWEELRIADKIVRAASGHKPNGVHESYVNFRDEQLTNAFRELMLPPAERAKGSKVAAAL